MDDMLILSVVAGVLTTIAFVMMYRDAKQQKEEFEAQEQAEAEKQAPEMNKPEEKKSLKKNKR